jgi:phosphoglucosamine mutase
LRKLFGTDGIRGVAGEYPITLSFCRKLAEAVVLKFCKDKSRLVIIGKDTRISGDMLEHVMAAAFCSFGVNVKLLGIVPTPAVAILTEKFEASVGVMISASHNPFRDNGLKLFNRFGLKLDDKEEEELEEIIAGSDSLPAETGSNIGRVEYDLSGLNFYREKIRNSFVFENPRIKILLDSSNGSFSFTAPNLLREFGFEVVSVNDSPNGVNINDNCGAVCPDVLGENVKRRGVDVGMAFDGDGDRVILADENGNILDGDQILAILAGAEHADEVVSTIMSNFGLERYLLSKGIRHVRTDVGDRRISERMQKSGAKLGGEQSGHIILRSHCLTGDGLFAGLKVLEYLLKSGGKCSELRLFEPLPAVSANVPVADKSVVFRPDAAEAVQKFTKRLEGRGKLIVRPSGTESAVRISVEGENPSELREIADALSQIMARS